jgi:hypothetical protein
MPGRGLHEDLTGRRYFRLKVLGDSGLRCGSQILWRCRCRCGSVTLVTTSNLTSGTNTLSCGCLHREICSGTPNGIRRLWRARIFE